MVEPTPINLLPEILIRIFHIVLAQPCLRPYFPYEKQYYPRYPDYLAQVCTLWRTIAIFAQTLWCHIDLSPNKLSADGLITRAEMYLARAGDLPIELNIAVNAIGNTTLEYDELYRLISLISSRVLLLRQRPALTKLVLDPQSAHDDNFLVPDSFTPTGAESYSGTLKLDSTEDEIESAFASLTILHSCGIFPMWSSKAYHGLVDLRLLSTDGWSHLREAELITILKSSPGLRILHFELEIHDSTPTTEKVIPVTLQALEVLEVSISDYRDPIMCPSSVLRLLAPGTKPLRLSLKGSHTEDAMLPTELGRFLARSKVARFYTRAAFLPIDLLLHHSAHLEQVVLDSFHSASHNQFHSVLTKVVESASLPHLRALHITRTALFDHELHLLLRCCPDGIVLSSCDIYHRIGVGHPDTILDAVEMSEVFPTVRITDHTLYPAEAPIADWDILD